MKLHISLNSILSNCIFSMFFFFMFSMFYAVCDAAIPQIEREALIALYNSTDGDNWTANDGWKTGVLYTDGFAQPGTECNWRGVICDTEHVTKLSLGSNHLVGSIPSEIGNLSNLLNLSLYNNQLTGTIPVEIGNLTNLAFLYLYKNQLTGSIPPEIGNLNNLLYLYLSNNQLTGIPVELGNLYNLEGLDLNDNQIAGTIPSEIGNLGALHELCLATNQFTGPLPPELGNLNNLLYLYLNNNHLSGFIPSEIGNLSALKLLRLFSNQFTGPISDSIKNLTLLNSTDIGYNALFTQDDSVELFLNSKDADWASTQTIPPSNVSVSVISETSVEVSWTAISYTEDPGGYQVFYSATAGGPYTLFDTTADKSICQMEVTGLNSASNHYFVVQTVTSSHNSNPNTVCSEYSEEVSIELEDSDNDDDGIANSLEASMNTDPNEADTDGDGIQDGTEIGLTLGDVGTDTDTNIFIPDADPSTTTDPLDADTDDDGLKDGKEDKNYNGAVDPGESDPNRFDGRTMPFFAIAFR